MKDLQISAYNTNLVFFLLKKQFRFVKFQFQNKKFEKIVSYNIVLTYF